MNVFVSSSKGGSILSYPLLMLIHSILTNSNSRTSIETTLEGGTDCTVSVSALDMAHVSSPFQYTCSLSLGVEDDSTEVRTRKHNDDV